MLGLAATVCKSTSTEQQPIMAEVEAAGFALTRGLRAVAAWVVEATGA